MLALVFLQYWAFSTAAPTDYDYFWHVTTGRLILDTGAVPRHDPYSYTVPGEPWVAHEWLTEVLMATVHAGFGYVGNVVVFGLVTTFAMACVFLTCRLHGVGDLASVVLMIWSANMATALWNVRAQMMTGALVAAWVLLLTLYKRGHRRAIWPLPLLMVLWINLHGGYVFGLVLLGVFFVGEAIDSLVQRQRDDDGSAVNTSVILSLRRIYGHTSRGQSEDPSQAQDDKTGSRVPRLRGLARAWATPLLPLVAVGVLAGLACLVSPHGIDGVLYPFSYLGNGSAPMRFIKEWQSPDFHDPTNLLLLASVVLAVVLGIGRRPLGTAEALWAALLALMTLQSMRHIALFAIVVTPLLGARLQECVPALRRSAATWRGPVMLGFGWLVLLASVAATAAQARERGDLPLGREPRTSAYPTGAVAHIRAHGLAGNIFNEYHWGGYLVYEFFPERQVYIDGRTDVYARLMARYVNTVAARPGWEQELADVDAALVLVERDGPLATALLRHADWTLVYEGSVERLFARR